jgi:hypothetical protein
VARDPLQVLLRLRGIGLDAARRALADRLRDEAAAAARCAGIEASIVHETQVHLSQPMESRTVGSYAAWLAHAQADHRDAQAASRTSAAATAEARVSLNEVRVETRALEATLEHAQEVRRIAAMRQEQQAIDEAAARCKRPERWSG